jgi:hypothetical protein
VAVLGTAERPIQVRVDVEPERRRPPRKAPRILIRRRAVFSLESMAGLNLKGGRLSQPGAHSDIAASGQCRQPGWADIHARRGSTVCFSGSLLENDLVRPARSPAPFPGHFRARPCSGEETAEAMPQPARRRSSTRR